MSRGPATFLKREAINHLLRAASAITNEQSFDLIETGAVIARAKTLPWDLSRTRELDLQLPDDERGRVIAILIDGSIGEGSQFDATFGYYANAIAEGTAQLPAGWRSRAMKIEVQAGLSCICPDPSDIALSKIAAWREKDIAWLRAATPTIVDIAAIRGRLDEIPASRDDTELRRRLDVVAGFARPLPPQPAESSGRTPSRRDGWER